MRENSMSLKGVPGEETRKKLEKGNIHRDKGQYFFKLGKINASDDLQIKVSNRINKIKFMFRIIAPKLEIYTHIQM